MCTFALAAFIIFLSVGRGAACSLARWAQLTLAPGAGALALAMAPKGKRRLSAVEAGLEPTDPLDALDLALLASQACPCTI